MTAEAGQVSHGASTPGQDSARRTITRTTITPAPGTIVPAPEVPPKASIRERLGKKAQHGDIEPAQAPYPGPSVLRLAMTSMLSVLCLLSVGGAILVLLLWQQNRDAGVLTTQVDRTWEIFGYLGDVERWLAFGLIPVVVAWIALATINVGRATGQHRSPIVAALSLPVGLAGVWLIGSRMIDGADDNITKAAGLAIQAAFLAIPLLALERVVEAAEARHRPLRVTYMVGVAYLANLQFLGGLSTTSPTSAPAEWGKLGAYLVIGALIQVLGTLSANEAARAIEEGTDHRYQLRHRFGETLLAQAKR